MVERSPEKAGVGSPILPLGTFLRYRINVSPRQKGCGEKVSPRLGENSTPEADVRRGLAHS